MRLLSISVLLALVAASCQPDLSDYLPQPAVYTSLQDFHSKSKMAPQQVTANSANTIFINGKKGSRFTLPANAFVTLNNQPVTGDVTIEVKEILTPDAMILSNMPTMSDGRPLESGGQFFIRATKNGEELKLAPGKFVEVNVSNNSPAMAGMQVFNGVTASDGTVNWQLNTNQGNIIRQDTLGGSGYTMFASDINWINIDKFYTEPRITYAVDISNAPSKEETLVYVHLVGRNTVFAFPKTGAGFVSDYLIAAPATIVALSVKDKKLYYAFAPVTLQDNGTTTLQFTETTENALKEKLKTLR